MLDEVRTAEPLSIVRKVFNRPSTCSIGQRLEQEDGAFVLNSEISFVQAVESFRLSVALAHGTRVRCNTYEHNGSLVIIRSHYHSN